MIIASTCTHPVYQLTARDNVLIQPHTSNEGRGELQDITADNKTSKRRPCDHEASPVTQRWDSPILIIDKHNSASCRTHHGWGFNKAQCHKIRHCTFVSMLLSQFLLPHLFITSSQPFFQPMWYSMMQLYFILRTPDVLPYNELINGFDAANLP